MTTHQQETDPISSLLLEAYKTIFSYAPLVVSHNVLGKSGLEHSLIDRYENFFCDLTEILKIIHETKDWNLKENFVRASLKLNLVVKSAKERIEKLYSTRKNENTGEKMSTLQEIVQRQEIIDPLTPDYKVWNFWLTCDHTWGLSKKQYGWVELAGILKKSKSHLTNAQRTKEQYLGHKKNEKYGASDSAIGTYESIFNSANTELKRLTNFKGIGEKGFEAFAVTREAYCMLVPIAIETKTRLAELYLKKSDFEQASKEIESAFDHLQQVQTSNPYNKLSTDFGEEMALMSERIGQVIEKIALAEINLFFQDHPDLKRPEILSHRDPKNPFSLEQPENQTTYNSKIYH